MNLKLPFLNKYTNNLNSRGQTTLIVVLMVMAVSLGVGLAVSQRSSSNIRRTTFTSQTDQAFSCANSAAEKALLCIKEREEAGDSKSTIEGACDISKTSLNNDSGTAICSYWSTVSNLKENKIELKKLEKNTVQQFKIDNSSSITLKWKKFTSGSSDSAIEVTHAYTDGSDYFMNKYAYICGSLPSGASGFDSKTPNAEGYCTATVNVGDGIGSPYTNGSILRIRPYFSDINIEVSGLNSTNDDQGYKIEAHGEAGTIQRNIEVLRMNPQLPAIFDYVLYSEEGSISK